MAQKTAPIILVAQGMGHRSHRKNLPGIFVAQTGHISRIIDAIGQVKAVVIDHRQHLGQIETGAGMQARFYPGKILRGPGQKILKMIITSREKMIFIKRIRLEQGLYKLPVGHFPAHDRTLFQKTIQAGPDLFMHKTTVYIEINCYSGLFFAFTFMNSKSDCDPELIAGKQSPA
jgi:hypothetical protein